MSWSGQAPPAYPPRPRSRSRSPYRGGMASGGGYPPGGGRMGGGYGEPVGGAYDYRGDWDQHGYDRERAWASYDRGMDYGRRRSRSPGGDDGRKRRRSMSPYDTRYEPRPRYEDYDGHRYGGRSPRSYGHNSRAPPDPYHFDAPASLKQFAEWFRYFYPTQAADEDAADKAAEHEAADGTKPRNGIKARWERYKKEFGAQQVQKLFSHHRNTPWFQEKYNPAPEFVRLRQRTRQRGLRGRLPEFLEQLDQGLFDPVTNAPAAEGEAVKEEDGAQNAGETNAEDDQKDMDADDAAGADESRAETNGKPTDGRGEARSGRDANRGAEISVPNDQNQVMIRTIPPDIGRLKLERAIGGIPGYIYVALGEPMQKRQFYRAAWIKFREDADMPTVMQELHDKKVEGFKLHVTHLLKPFVNRIRHAPEVASKPSRLAKDLANARQLTKQLETEYAELRSAEIPPAGAPEESAKDGGENAQGAGKDEQGGGDVNMDRERRDEEQYMDVLPPLEPEEELPVDAGSEAIEKRAERLLQDAIASGAVDGEDDRAVANKRTELTLDLYLAYLRAAFHTCYYCALTTDHMEELQRRCIKHERRPLGRALAEEIRAAEAEERERAQKETDAAREDGAEGQEGEAKEGGAPAPADGEESKKGENREWKRNDERWLDWLDSKIALLLNKDGVNPADYGGKNFDDELHKTVEVYVKMEDEGKFRCKTCQKLFKATAFVEKHVANKHPELVKSLDELPFYNNFALDPYRIQPLREPPPQAQAPPHYPPGGYDNGHSRGGAGYGHPPPPYANGGGAYHDPYYPGGGGPRGVRGGGLSERLGGYDAGEGLPLASGLPAKPMLDQPLSVGAGGGRGPAIRAGGPPPPPPPDAKEDPRAAQGRRSYHDMDLVAEGDVELQY